MAVVVLTKIFQNILASAFTGLSLCITPEDPAAKPVLEVMSLFQAATLTREVDQTSTLVEAGGRHLVKFIQWLWWPRELLSKRRKRHLRIFVFHLRYSGDPL